MKSNAKIILFIGVSVFALEAHAQKFYKWVDEYGVTHYAQEMPSQNTKYVAFEFTENYQTANPQEDYYSIQNQLKRLQERRVQENSQKQIETARAKQQPPEIIYVNVNESDHGYYAPAYFPHYKGRNFNNKYHGHFPKRGHHKRQYKTNPEKPRAGISQKPQLNQSGAVFSASR